MKRLHNPKCFPVLLLILAILLPIESSAIDSIGKLQLKNRIMVMISGFEQVPAEDTWKKLDPAAAEILRDIASDDEQLPGRRARAVSALAHFPTVETRAFLVSLFEREERIAGLLQRKALYALASGFEADAVEDIAMRLPHSDYYVREAAVLALVKVGNPDAFNRIRDHRKMEKETILLQLIDRELAKIEKK